MAAKGRRISGIYVPIQLDTQQINQDIERLNTKVKSELGSIAAAMSQSLGSALNPRKLIGNFSQLIQGLGNVRDAAKALQSLKPFGNFDRTLGSNAITPQLRELAQTLGITEQAQRKLLQQMAKNTAIQTQVNGLRQLERTMGTARKETIALAQSLGMLLDRAAKTQYLGSQGRGILGAFSPSNMTAGIQSAMGAMGVVGGMYGVVELGKSMTQAALKMENITLAFESIYQSGTMAADKLQFIKGVADQLGISFVDAAEGGKKIFAAARGTEVEAQAEKIYSAFANMGAALKLTGDEMNSVFLAISQSISKGALQAEEVRSQLAERMPGAVQLLAKSIGVTTRELDKMFQRGEVGLQYLVGFAEEVRKQYEVGAMAASHGLQAELGRLSTAWFELKAAFVDTDSLAKAVRVLAEGMKYLASNSDSIASLAGQLLKFVAISAGVYALGRSVTALVGAFTALKGVMTASSFAGFMAALGPVGGAMGTISVVAGGLITLLTNLHTETFKGQDVINKYKDSFFDLDASIQGTTASIEAQNEKMKAIQLNTLQTKLQDAKNAIADLFDTEDIVVDLDATFSEAMDGATEIISQGESAINSLYNRLGKELKDSELFQNFREAAQKASEDFRAGIARGLNGSELNKLFIPVAQVFSDFRKQLSKAKASPETLKSFQELSNTLNNVFSAYIQARAGTDEWLKAQEKASTAADQSTAAFERITKLAQGTDLGKENKIATTFKVAAQDVVLLANNAYQAELALYGLENSTNATKQEALSFQNQIDEFNDSIPLLAASAIKNGLSFQDMAAGIEQAGIKAGMTKDAIEELKRAVNAAMNVQIGATIEASLAQLDTKIAMVGAKTAQTTAFNILTTGITDEAAKTRIGAALMSKDMKALRDEWVALGRDVKQVDSVIEKTTLYGSKLDATKGGGSRGAKRMSSSISEARKKTIDFAKEIGDVQKKIAELQGKIDDDPSIKFLNDVQGELKKIKSILDSGLGTQKEREELKALSEEYEKYANMRAKQMAEEERRQKAIEAASKFGRGYGNLSDVSGAVNSEMQVAAFQAEYEQMVIDWNKALDDQIVSYEQYAQGIADLTSELQVKTDSANGSMVANFTDHINQSYEQIKDWQSEVSDILMTGVTSMSDAFAEFFITNINDTKSLEEAFGNMVQSMIKSLAQLFMQMIIIGTLKKALGLFGGDGESGYEQVMSLDMSKFIPSAKGNVFSGGNISRYSNSIVTAPTTFSYASHKAFGKGGGIMGERGPEAVVPLIRTRGGNLGVRAEGGFGSGQQALEMNQAISINIINNTDSKVSAKKASDSNGNLNIQVMIEKMVADSLKTPGSPPFRVMQNEWQGATKLASRG